MSVGGQDLGRVLMSVVCRPPRSSLFMLVLLLMPLLAGCDEAARRASEDSPTFANLRTMSLAPPPNHSGAREVAARPLEPPAPPPQTQVVYGDNRYVGGGGGAAPPGATSDGAGGIQLNFDNADLREFVKLVLGDVLGLNYLIDPRVQGSVTLSSTEPIPTEDLLPTLETVLRLNNAAILRDRGLYKVVPLADAIGQPGFDSSVAGPGGTLPFGQGITVVPLRFVSAANMVTILENVVSRPGQVRADPARNMLIVSGTARERASIVDTVNSFDVNWLRGQSAGIFPLRHAAPEAVIAELQELMQANPDGLGATVIRFLPIERLNAVLAVAKTAEVLQEARRWIVRLDQANTAGLNLYVYFAQNTKAEDLADVLNEAFGLSGSGAASRRSVSPSLDPVVVSGDGGGAGAADAAPRAVPASLSGAALSAFSLADIGDVRIIADKVNNALLIMANRRSYELIQSALRQIDVPPPQVLIDATIAEVSLNDQLRYGVQFFLKGLGIGFGNEVSGGYFGGPDQTLAGGYPGFNLFVTNGNEARVVIDALSAVTDVKVVSAPSVVVLDNQTANLQVGDEVPVSTRQSTSVDNPDAPVVNSIEFRNTGVILEVTPRINSSGIVSMDIQQEVSNVAPTSGANTLTPTISQRKIASSVSVVSGQTVVLGGLINDRQTAGKSGIPGLRDLPLVGPVFGSTNIQNNRTELIVFIRPQIIRDGDEAERVSEELRSRLRSLAPPPAVTTTAAN